MSMEISNTQDIIDSREIIERIDELQDIFDDLEYRINELESDFDDLDEEDYHELEELKEEYENMDEERDELEILLSVQEQAGGYGDWNYGEALIHENYFVEYVEGMLKDIGDLPNDIPWYIEINWEATADNIKSDYTEIDFDGEIYYMRA